MKRILTLLITLSLISGMVTVNDVKVEADVNAKYPFVIEDTNYGIYDYKVIGKKITLTDSDTEILNDKEYRNKGFVFIKKKIDNVDSMYYLVDSTGCIAEYKTKSTWKPKASVINLDFDNYGDIIVMITDPNTGKYDIYNNTKHKYYNYQIDDIDDEAAYLGMKEFKKNEKYGVLNSSGEMIYDPIYESISWHFTENGKIRYGLGYVGNKFAIITNGKKTSQNKYYDEVYSSWRVDFDGEIIPLCDGNDTVLLSLNTGKILATYSNTVWIGKHKDKYGECLWVEWYDENDNYQVEIVSDEGVISVNSLLNEKNLDSDPERGIITQGGMFGYGFDPFSCYIDNKGKIIGKKYYTIEIGNSIVNEISFTEGVYCGLIAKCDNKFENQHGFEYYLLDEKENKVLDGIGVPVSTNEKYIIAERKNGNLVVFDAVKREILKDNIEGYCWERDRSIDLIITHNKKNDKYGLIDLEVGKELDAIYEEEEMESYDNAKIYKDENNEITVFKFDDDIKIQNEKNKIVFDGYGGSEVFVDSDLNIVLEVADEPWAYKIIDCKGNLIRKFDTFFNFEEINVDDGKKRLYISNEVGLINSDGSIILDSNDNNTIRECDRNFVYVTNIATNTDTAAIVDQNGRALIYGEYDEHLFKRLVGGFCLRKDDAYYLYDFQKCAGDSDENTEKITEEQLFGEYANYLNNEFYNSIYENINNDIANTISSYAKYDKILAATKSLLVGQGKFVVKQIINSLPGTSLDETKINQELALEYLKNIDTDYIIKNVNSLLKEGGKVNSYSSKIIKVYKEINNLKTDENKLKFAEIMAGDNISESTIYNSVNEALDEKAKILKAGGEVSNLLEYLTVYFTICEINNDIVTSIMKLIPADSELYNGLAYINKKQTMNGGIMYSFERLNDEALSILVGFAENNINSALDLNCSGLIVTSLKLAGYLAGNVMNTVKLEDLDKATLALTNVCTLKKAVDDYRKVISNNYAYNGNVNIETLKENYSILTSTYFQSLLRGLEYANKIAKDNSELIKKHTKQFEKKLIYRSYINSCMLNARARWEYEIKANKAVIKKMTTDLGDSGRVSYIELLNEYNEDYDEPERKTQKCIVIPKKIDGYEVAEVQSSTFEDEIDGVFIPESINKFSNEAFSEDNSVVAISPNEDILNDIEDKNVSVSNVDNNPIKIEMVNEPSNKQVEFQGEPDLDGIKIKVTYEDGSEEIITNGLYAVVPGNKIGDSVAKVYYKGLTVEYNVEVLKTECDYIVSYEDEYGNKLKENDKGSAEAQSVLKITPPELKDYIPISDEFKFSIGKDNYFQVVYKKKKSGMIDQANVIIPEYYVNKENWKNEIAFSGTVNVRGEELELNRDYSVVYQSYQLGKNQLTIVGKGNYYGVLTVNYDIVEQEHYWGDWEEQIKATEVKEGKSIRRCFICYKIEEKKTPKLQKNYSQNTITLGKVSNIKCKKVKRKKIILTWNKVKNAMGYRVRYSQNKKLKKCITKYTTKKSIILKKLKKGKKYYVRVNAYYINGNNKVYGPTSKIKKVKR